LTIILATKVIVQSDADELLRSTAELAAFASQAKHDWETLLLRRARELVPGGRLVLVNFCQNEAGRYLGHTGGVHMFDTFNRLWQHFATEGVIGVNEYVRMTLPHYFKTVEEFTRPLTDPASPVYGAGLRLEHCETRVVPRPFAAAFRQHGDAARFARAYIPTLQSWSESTFLAALAPDRSPGARQASIERYYNAYET